MPKTEPTKDRFDDLPADRGRVGAHRAENPRIRGGLVPVSYTHLTLPTNREV